MRPRLIPGSDDQHGNLPAPPEEQRDLQQTLIKAGTMIHSPKSRDAVLNSLHQPDKTVAQAVGQTAAQILMTVDQQKQAVTKVPLAPEIMREAARYVIPELMNIGISAGIFPLKPPPGSEGGPGPQSQGNDENGPGRGSDPYNRELRMAMLEATKVYGEAKLKSPEGPQLTAQAQDEWASNVKREVASGTANPQYMAMIKARQQPGVGAPSATDMSQNAPPGGSPPA